jgi:DNA-binding response OmpR family regulator
MYAASSAARGELGDHVTLAGRSDEPLPQPEPAWGKPRRLLKHGTISAVDGQHEASAALEFGRFKVVPHRREVVAAGAPITIGSCAFDTLLVLVDAGGSVIDKAEGFDTTDLVVANTLLTTMRAH